MNNYVACHILLISMFQTQKEFLFHYKSHLFEFMATTRTDCYSSPLLSVFSVTIPRGTGPTGDRVTGGGFKFPVFLGPNLSFATVEIGYNLN